MPKQKITKEMVVNAAFELAKSSGPEYVIVKNIAEKLGCSVQPIYSYCRSMDGLRRDVIKQVKSFVHQYTAERIDRNNLFQSTGQAYVQLAKEEPHIFRMFILHNREGISSLNELYQSETDPDTAEFIARKLNISLKQAEQLHMHMLIYTIGIGTIFSVTSPGIPADEIFGCQEAAYQAFLNQTLEESRDEK